MLKQRVITALVLLAVLIPALLAPAAWPFALLMLLAMGAAAWEWAQLNGLQGAAGWLVAAVCVALCLASWALGLPQQRLPGLWLAGGGAWVLAAAALLHRGVPGWPGIARPVRLVAGVLALWLAWLAVTQARLIGVNFLLSIFALVWTADIAAYFAGRAFGLKFTKGKLAPAISPGKSWEGVWGGACGVLLLAAVWIALDAQQAAAVPSFYSRLFAHSWWLLVVALVFMTAMSVAGDLVESLVKRSAGMKDSSQLLPGHGGVLDRIDALLPTLPLAMMITQLLPA
ncbi:phosphatidate cytidylyltransferase [Comamonas humi]